MLINKEIINKWKIGWGFTSACNMNCPFCYSNKVRKDFKEIELQQAIRFVENNFDYIESINYGTGENSLSDQWFQLIKYISERYMQIEQCLTTNGSIVDRIYNKKIAPVEFFRWIKEIDLSLDFADEDKHNRMRGNDNAYQWIIRTLELCQEYGVTATIVMVAFDETLEINNIRDIFKLAKQYDAYVRMNILRPTTNMPYSPPTFAVLMETLGYIFDNYKIVSLSDPVIGSLKDYDNVKEEATGITSLRILPDGYITPSTYLLTKEWYSLNIKDENVYLKDIRKTGSFERIIDGIIPDSCRECMYAPKCKGGAVDRRILHYGSLEQSDPYCPKRNGVAFIVQGQKLRFSSSQGQPKIHDGYLPTLIFEP